MAQKDNNLKVPGQRYTVAALKQSNPIPGIKCLSLCLLGLERRNDLIDKQVIPLNLVFEINSLFLLSVDSV